MRLGLFGGTFDPIHLGHLILAEQCREACGLDRVWLVVAGSPPHKPGGRTGVGHRLEMVRIAIAGHPAFVASDIEATRPGPHYSVETLEAVRRRSSRRRAVLPDRRRQPAGPPLMARDRSDRATGDDRRGQPARHRGGRGRPACPTSGPARHPLRSVTIPPVGIASSDLRRRIGESRSIRYLVPRGVEAYIHAQGLYTPADADDRS